MKRAFGFLLALVLVLSFNMITAAPAAANGTSTIEVTQPLQVTSDSYYERGQSIVYDGSDYWLFYGRSDTVTDTYGSGNPDTHDYVVYYKKAGSISGLAAASATQVTGTYNTNLYLGETDAAYFGGEVWVFASHDTGGSCDLYAWRTTDGTSWTETSVVTGLPVGAAHFAATTCDGKLWLAYQLGNDWESKYYDGSSWSSAYDITANYGTAKFYVEGTSLHFVRADGGDQDIHEWDGGSSSWSMIDSATETGPYDPTVYKIGSNYVLAYAPWVSPKQWIKAKVGASLTTLLSSGTEVMITAAEYDTNTWIDMWPTGFLDNAGDTYLFFTSERNPSDTSSEIAGNIWYLPVEWTVTNDHYTYIQNAIDAASPGDTITVAEGEYGGAIVDKEVVIVGAADGASIITSGVHYGGGASLYTGFRLDAGADGAEIRNFTVNCDDSSGFFFGVFSRGIDDVVVDSLTVNGPVQGITNWGGSNWEITDNELSYTEASGGGGIGIFVGATPTLYRVSSGNLIASNTIGATATAEAYSTPGIVIALDLRYGRYDLLDGNEDVSGNEVLSNTIVGNGGENSAGIEIGVIGLEGDPVKIAATMGIISATTVQGNVIEEVDLGLYFYVVSNLTVTDNEMLGCSYGMYTADGIEDATIEDNTFGSNAIQVNDLSEDLDLQLILANNTFDQAVVVRGSPIKVPTIFSSIQDAIAAAESGDTIEVAAGTYVEEGQIVIDKDLTITGEDKEITIIKPAQDTGSSGNARGWFLVQAGNEFNLSNVALDGQGWNIHQAIRSHGSGTIDNNIIKNIRYAQYIGLGVVVMGDDSMTISNNTFTDIERIGIMAFGGGVTDAQIVGNIYIGKGEADALDYGVEVGGGANAAIEGNTITNCIAVAESDGSESAGILVTDYYGPGTEALITENTLAGNTMGIAVGYLETDQSLVVAHYNSIFGNEVGVENYGAVAVNATHNWWGHDTGPYHEMENPDGEGDAVSDNVLFDPWLGADDVDLTVSTQPATTVTRDAATLNMIYTLGPYTEVNVGFAYKKSGDATWSHTGWVVKTADGTHAEALAGLDPKTDYDFKAQLQYDETVIEGDELHFTTVAAPPTVETQAATDVSMISATLNMNYTVGDFSPMQVRFAYKESAGTEWSYTGWESKTEDGTHAEELGYHDLSLNTEYDFKAQLRYDNTVIEGATLHFSTIYTGVPGCFIATAAYGTPTHVRIDVLREFRDVVLLESAPGSRFVTWYYQTSPPIAEFIAGNETLRTLVRVLLVDPIVWLVESTGAAWRN